MLSLCRTDRGRPRYVMVIVRLHCHHRLVGSCSQKAKLKQSKRSLDKAQALTFMPKQYNIKQTSNHKTYTYRPTKLQIQLLIIRKSKANKTFLNLFVVANNQGSFTERRRRLVTVSSRFAGNRWWRQSIGSRIAPVLQCLAVL